MTRQSAQVIATSAPSDYEEVHAFLRAYNDILLLAEPLLMDLWQFRGLTFAQLRILRQLRTKGPTTASQLALLAGISGPSLARIVSRLEDDGLVERRIHRDDRRRIEVLITDQGRKRLGDRGMLTGTIFEKAAEVMPHELRVQLTDALANAHRYLEDAAAGHPRLSYGLTDKKTKRPKRRP